MIIEFDPVQLVSLRESSLMILKDYQYRLMAYQQVISRYPITEASVQAALIQVVNKIREVKTTSCEFATIEAVCKTAHEAMVLANLDLENRYGRAFMAMFWEIGIWLYESDVAI